MFLSHTWFRVFPGRTINKICAVLEPSPECLTLALGAYGEATALSVDASIVGVK